MDTHLTSAFISNANCTLPPGALKNAIAIAVVGCLFAGGFTAAAGTAGAARSEHPDTGSVNRIHKGDRLPLALKLTSTISSPIVSTMPRAPFGCDPAFSRAADPARAHIFGRCIS
jgi:hypothetical protein